jgi:hypothetical protein
LPAVVCSLPTRSSSSTDCARSTCSARRRARAAPPAPSRRSVHHRQDLVGVLGLGGDQHAAPPDRLGVEAGALGLEAALDQVLGEAVARLLAEDGDRALAAAGLDQRAADPLRRLAAPEQSDRQCCHGEFSFLSML